jgi:hypothetical protein
MPISYRVGFSFKSARALAKGAATAEFFLMGTYEIQVLDSYQNETYADGQGLGRFMVDPSHS